MGVGSAGRSQRRYSTPLRYDRSVSGTRIRASVVRILDHGDTTTVIGPKATRSYSGDSAELLRAILEIYTREITRDELFGELAQRTGGEVPPAPVDQLIALLVEDGVLVTPRAPVQASFVAPRRIVLAITGAIAAIDAPILIRSLHAAGCEVRVALSRTARRFVSVEALEALTHHAVWKSIWQRDPRVPVPHINLAEWAELVVVCPASATSLARIATGDCSDLVSALVTATRAPVVLVPSMNDAMYESPAVQDNLATLRAHGRWLVHPAHGHEVAHRPGERRAVLGPAPPAAAIVDIIKHLLAQIAPRAQMPRDGADWERLWSGTPTEALAWHADDIDAPLAAALDTRSEPGKRLLDLGTGAGTVAIAAARRGFRVTATDIAPTALGRARDRAGELPILFVLDDVTTSRIAGPFDVAVDCGLLHCLPRDRWAAYATSVSDLIAPGGSLLLVAHEPGGPLATHALTSDDVTALLPRFQLIATAPSTLAKAPARLFELQRS